MRPPVTRVIRSAWRRQSSAPSGDRIIAEETPIAFIYNGSSYAVMMATPQDLQDFAVGFSLTEGVVSKVEGILQLEIVEQSAGIELRMWLDEKDAATLSERRRFLAGPTGCGLCGIESLEEAVKPVRSVGEGRVFAPDDIVRAIDALAPRQLLNLQTRAVHAAAFWHAETGLAAVREDVGRHNALDKLCGMLARASQSANTGMILLTSRVSVEMVQKAAAIGAPLIVAVSAPTALAVRTAESAGITLVAIARGDGFEIFTHGHRISDATAAYGT